jgi:glucose-1-phosphate thymidylyltransferase
MIDDGVQFKPHLIDEWFDCGKPEAMLKTNRRLLEDSGAGAPSIEGCVIIPPVSISPDAEISNSIVGPYVSVAEKAVIRNSILRDSIVSAGATVKDAQLESSLVGTKAAVRGGFRRVDIGDSSEIAFK